MVIGRIESNVETLQIVRRNPQALAVSVRYTTGQLVAVMVKDKLEAWLKSRAEFKQTEYKVRWFD